MVGSLNQIRMDGSNGTADSTRVVDVPTMQDKLVAGAKVLDRKVRDESERLKKRLPFYEMYKPRTSASKRNYISNIAFLMHLPSSSQTIAVSIFFQVGFDPSYATRF